MNSMNKKKFRRVILGLVLLAFCLFAVVPFVVFAAPGDKPSVQGPDTGEDDGKAKSETPIAGKAKCDKNAVDELYNIEVDTTSTSDGDVTGFKVTITTKKGSTTTSDLNFKLFKIANKNIDNRTIAPDKGVVTITDRDNIASYFEEVTNPDDGNRYHAKLWFETIKGSNDKSVCETGDKFYVETSVAELGAVMETIAYGSDEEFPAVLQGHQIDFNGSRESLSTFDQLIYDAYWWAKDNGKHTFTEGTVFYQNKPSGWNVTSKVSLKCDYADRDFTSATLKGSGYYRNTKYAYGQNTFQVKGGNYVYHTLGSGEGVSIPGQTCDVTCEEGVRVEYGPPVASKAGLCFEYKVRVTSHVNCYAKSDIPSFIKSGYTLCTPTPSCVHASGYELDRAGPNEDFAACINKCDGGKYSLKCSKKCYKKVYGTSKNNISNSLYSDYVAGINSELSESCGDTYGCFYFADEGNIRWAGKDTNYVKTFAQFYDTAYGSTYLGRYYTNGGKSGQSLHYIFSTPSSEVPGEPYYKNCSGYNGYGFARKIYSSSSCCDAVCSWKGCTEPEKKDANGNTIGINYYINGGENKKQIEDDYAANLETYKKFVKKCNAAASCTTTTAQFSMSVNYKTGEESRTISFPYDEEKPYTKEDTPSTISSNPDELCSNGHKGSCTSTYTNKNSTIIYRTKEQIAADDSDAMKQIASEVPDGCYDPTKKDDNAKDINSTSNRTYRATITFPGAWINYKTGEITFKPVTDTAHWEHIDNKFCIPREAKDVNQKYWLYYQKDTVCKKTVNSINESDVKSWNIKATIIDFGLYNWDFDVSCFYALDEEDNTCEPGTPTDVNTAYRIRSIDLTDMFPNTEGEGNGGAAQTGREPGFNWTDSAAVTNSKNAYYKSNPTTLINNIQSVGYGVYSAKYLDYEFNLDRNTLREMRREINNNNYTDFDEDGFKKSDKAGIGYYYSERIRKLAGKNKTPDPKIIDLVCNNLQLTDSGEYIESCEPVNGESEE